MAIMASKGELDVLEGMDGERDVRSEAEPKRSAAAPTTPVDEDWIWEAEYSLLFALSVYSKDE
jgi:hypothetical protein